MKKKADVKIDPTLNQYEKVTMFPEKLKRAKEFLKAHPLPGTVFIPAEELDTPWEDEIQSKEM